MRKEKGRGEVKRREEKERGERWEGRGRMLGVLPFLSYSLSSLSFSLSYACPHSRADTSCLMPGDLCYSECFAKYTYYPSNESECETGTEICPLMESTDGQAACDGEYVCAYCSNGYL